MTCNAHLAVAKDVDLFINISTSTFIRIGIGIFCIHNYVKKSPYADIGA